MKFSVGIHLPEVWKNQRVSPLVQAQIVGLLQLSLLTPKQTEDTPHCKFILNHGGDLFAVYQQNQTYYALILLLEGFVFMNQECDTFKDAYDLVNHQFLIDLDMENQ